MNSKPNTKLFNSILIVLISTIFVLNYLHLNQSGTYYQVFLQIVDNLNRTGLYTYSVFDGSSATYPIWGYPILLYVISTVTSNIDLGILLLQAGLTFYGLQIFYRLFEIERQWSHLFLFLPFIALMSVKWPDAIVGFLLILLAYFFKRGLKDNSKNYFLLSGLILGLICNFRSEYIFLPVMGLLVSLLPFLKSIRRKVIVGTLLSILVMLLSIAPWMLHYYNATGTISPSSSNGAAVAYISLGQLNGNKWGIVNTDKTAFDLAASDGIDNPFSHEGNQFFQDEFMKAVQEYPVEYFKKCGSNFLKMMIGGVYTGEYANLVIDENKRLKINQDIRELGGIKNKFDYVVNDIEPIQSISLILEKLLQFVFIPLVFILLLTFFYSIFRYDKLPKELLFLIISLISFKIIMVSLIQYEYRHINGIYLFLLGLYLLNNFTLKRKKKN